MFDFISNVDDFFATLENFIRLSTYYIYFSGIVLLVILIVVLAGNITCLCKVRHIEQDSEQLLFEMQELRDAILVTYKKGGDYERSI